MATVKLSDRNRLIVGMIGEGLNRAQIAGRLGVNPNAVRVRIREMCEDYDCSQGELPEVVAQTERRWRCMCGVINEAGEEKCSRCDRVRQEEGEHY